jgi:cob(I)alamin adenosyltransferase
VVNLTKLYTKTGDGGRTHLGDGTQVGKTDPRVEAIGAVDELNAIIGVALSVDGDESIEQICQQIQNDLFDVGADVCKPAPADEQTGESLRLDAAKTGFVESWIDTWNDQLPSLRSFILPGGSPRAALFHQARTVCRRAERRVISLRESGGQVSEPVVIYLNRLSDLLFVFARIENRADGDILWEPGGEG